jgi:hypothetical protein
MRKIQMLFYGTISKFIQTQYHLSQILFIIIRAQQLYIQLKTAACDRP